MSDVSASGSQQTWELAFQRSRWFTRGWTLQELIAPQSVEFFSVDGKRLGDKASLEWTIQSRTGIPVSVLRGMPLSYIKIDERLRWGKERQTRLKEDAAYCLLGICGVFIALLYGEGKENAFERLLREVKLSKDLENEDVSDEQDYPVKGRRKVSRNVTCHRCQFSSFVT
jgi:hypothetical protein